MKTKIPTGAPGLILDPPDVILPDGAWTEAVNFQFTDGAIEKCRGTVGVFNSASATAIWVEPVSDGLVTFWVYGDDTQLYATDGSAHANVSSITYTCNPVLGYTGGAYHGYMIANDAVNPPQSWSPSLGNKFQPLTAWPASTTCEVIRPFGDFLVALRITESGTYNSRLVRWSDRGQVGALPASWDYTDPTNQAGRTELGQTYDEIVDCLPLRDANIIYKQFHTWSMNYIGGLDVFSFREIFKETGLLTENCVKAFGPRHFMVSDNDILIHDGNDAQSVADKRLRRWLFSRLSTTAFQYAFVAPDYKNREMWFCFPEEGADYPNMAACWSWADNVWWIRELGDPMYHASSGIIEASGVTFDADPGEFDTGPAGEFDEYDYTPWSQRLLFAPANKAQLLQGNASYKFHGDRTITAYAARTNIGLTQDVGKIKRIHRILPYVRGAPGDVIKFRIGASENFEGPITLTPAIHYTIGSDHKIDCRITGRHISLIMETTNAAKLQVTGFDIEFDQEGNR